MLSIRRLTKPFASVEALKSVDLDVEAGEVHGLVGANGSGKTTLLNILFGNPIIGRTGGYRGKILLNGAEVHISSPARALALGIGMIHQESTLIPGMTVAENVRIGRESTYRLLERLLGRRLAAVRTGLDRTLAGLTLSKLGMESRAGDLVRNLSPSLRPFVEMAREMDKAHLGLLLLDEPTAVLNNTEAHHLVQIVRRMTAGGTASIYVSHRLEEVMAISDRVTVLRDGRVAGRFRKSEYDLRTIAECMTGHAISKARKEDRRTSSQVLMKIEDIHVNKSGERLSGACLDIMQGEILGVAGLSGHGKLAFGPGIVGMVPTSGRVFLEGALLDHRTPAGMLAKGICCLPDDRNQASLLLDHSITDNIVFGAVHGRGRFLRSPRLGGVSLIDKTSAHIYAEQCVERFRIKCRSVRQEVRELSGGNRQKVCLARALATDPRLLLMAEPTHGVDIEAKEVLLRILLDLNHRFGMTILVASSELDELKRICDRIAVVRQGRVTQVLGPQDEDRRFMLAFSGKIGEPE